MKRKRRTTPATDVVLDLSVPIELVALSIEDRAVRCRLLGSEWRIIFRGRRLWDVVPGEIATVIADRQWYREDGPHLSGKIESTRIAAGEIGLVPLELQERGIWDPGNDSWGEENGPIGEWAQPIIARGPRRQLAMQRVLPHYDPEVPPSDPIIQAKDPEHRRYEGTLRTLMQPCLSDLRCLDAHSRLGNLGYEHWPQEAIRHYEVGLRIGELSLGEGFDGVLAWGLIDNRPFLRCMYRYGLCLWRLGRFVQAEEVFERMRWLNPPDEQGVRFLIDDVRAGRSWEEHAQEHQQGRRERGNKNEVLRALGDTPSWTWPATGRTLIGILRDAAASESDRLLAARFAGQCVYLDDDLVDALMWLVSNGQETDKLRGQAALVLGPVVETADVEAFDPFFAPFPETTYLRIMTFLRSLYADPDVPDFVRKRILEASVRGIPIDVRDWHQGAVREAYASDDEDWQRTAVYSMRWVADFEAQIVESLDSTNPDIRCQAVHAVASWEIEEAWPQILALVTSGDNDTSLMLAVVGAVAAISPHPPHEVLGHLIDSDDKEVAVSARRALGIIDSLIHRALAADDDEQGLFIH